MRFFLLFLTLLTATNAQAEPEAQVKILKNSSAVLEEILDSPDEEIPAELISNAKAIVVFPTMVKGGFMVAAQYGRGVATARSPRTGEWSPPSFVTTVGGSFGFQIGAEAVDLILLVMSQRGLEGLLQDKFTLGGDVGVAAGPIGRHAEAGADLMMQGEIYSYSRSKGAFAGLSLKGTIIAADESYNREYYGSAHTPKEILLDGKIDKYPESTRRFLKQLSRLAPAGKKPARSAPPPSK